MEGDVGFAADVGDVDAGAAAGHEEAAGLLPGALQQFAVLGQGEVLVVVFADGVGRRGDHEMDAAGREAIAIGGRDAGVEQDLVDEVRGQGVLGVGGGLAFG